MNVLFERKALAAALSALKPYAMRDRVILSGDTDGGGHVLAGNGDLRASVPIPCRVLEHGTVQIVIGDLLPLLRKMAAFTFVTVETKAGDSYVHASAGATEAKIGASAETEIPPIVDGSAKRVACYATKRLEYALDRIAPFVSDDSTRYGLAGVAFQDDHAVATDGSKLLAYDLDATVKLPFVLPKSGADLLRGLIAIARAHTCTIDVAGDSAVRATLDTGAVLECRQPFPAKDFPKYKSVLPAGVPDLTLTFEPAALIAAVQRCALFASICTLEYQPGDLEAGTASLLAITTTNGSESIHDTIEASGEGSWRGRQGFKAEHLLPGLEAMDTGRRMLLHSPPLGSCVLEVVDGVCIVMPTRLD